MPRKCNNRCKQKLKIINLEIKKILKILELISQTLT